MGFAMTEWEASPRRTPDHPRPTFDWCLSVVGKCHVPAIENRSYCILRYAGYR